MTNSDHSALVQGLIELSIKAGDVIMDVYAREFSVSEKEDRSPVTEADGAAEEIILKGLKALAPDIPVVAEEEFSEGVRREIGDRFFLVDPLDGTREFINKNGEFTVNIGLIEDGQPVVGVVYAPATGRLFAGHGPDTAIEMDIKQAGSPKPIEARTAPKGGMTAIASRSHRDQKTEEYLNLYNINEFKSAGSSLKFCLIAAGEADIYPRHGRTMEWDTAAGHAVLAAAGGTVTKLDGSPFLYGKEEEGFANPFFVARGRI